MSPFPLNLVSQKFNFKQGHVFASALPPHYSSHNLFSTIWNNFQTFQCRLNAALKFAMKWGRGIDENTNHEFVNMYVNNRTIDYRDDGRDSVKKFLRKGQEIGLIDSKFNVSELKFIGFE